MLRISDITYAVEGRPLFEGASATIPIGHKVGLVGRNGTGKTTLFRLIRGEISLEAGDISVPKGARIGGVAQEVPTSQTSLLDTVLAADTERGTLMAEAETATDPTRIADIQTRLADIDAWSAEARASSILKGLGFDDHQHALPCADFSGGWRMRVALAAVLFAQPDLLLLDEPTNYLDLEGALWLEQYLTRYPHTVIIISHDRGLLNRSVGAILHLEDRKLALYQGPYDTFAETRAARLAVAEAENRKVAARRAHLQSFVDRFRYKESKAKQAQSRLKMIERLKTITTPQEAALKAFSFPEPEELSPPIINLESASCGYDDTPVLSRLDLRIDQDDRIALLGKNGQGKSTLSKLLSDRLDVMDGRMIKSSKLRIGYFAQHQMDELHADETPIEHLRRHHLDIESREALVEALTAYTGAVILVSHDMHLLGLVADHLWLVNDGGVTPFEGDLEDYRKLLLSSDASAKQSRAATERPKPKRADRDTLLTLRADLRKCEDRIQKLEHMRGKLDAKLADPALYEPGKATDIAVWQKKHAEVIEGLERAEALWLDAQNRLEQAESSH